MQHLRVKGSGKVSIVLIPGGPGLPYTYMDSFIDYLSDKYKTVSYNTFKYREAEYQMKNTSDELNQVIEDHCQGPFILLGHSFGGNVILEYLRSYPHDKRLLGFVCCNTMPNFKKYNQNLLQLRSALPEQVNQKIKGFEESQSFGEDYLNLIMTEWLPRHMYKNLPMDSSLEEALGALDMQQVSHFLGSDLLKVQGEMIKQDYSDILQKINIPALFVCGEHDTVFEEDVKQMASQSNGAYHVFPEVAHYPFLEKENEFFTVLNGFLENSIKK